MKMKVKALAMAACMGLSLNAFAQSYGSEGRDTSMDGRAESERMQDRVTPEQASASGHCGGIREHRARTICMDAQASRGGSTVPLTQQPAASGPGAIDKTHPGSAGAGFSVSPSDVGTSSAGSGA